MAHSVTAPEIMPVLSRGKHRNPRRGACFMEMASYLAGERWSDHPSCTHPLLAQLARLVNDSVTDPVRARLVPLIPSVIGLNSDDVRVDVAIALRAALAALPIAAADRQHVLATAVLACERVLADVEGRDPYSLSPQTREALDQVPEAAAWALSFSRGTTPSRRTFRTQTAPHILNLAVEGIALACARGVDESLVDLLVDTIAECQGLVATGEAALSPAETSESARTSEPAETSESARTSEPVVARS